MKLLWIDDDKKMNRFRYEAEVIESHGWKIIWAQSIKEAAKFLSTETFEVIFLDQQCPYEIPEPIDNELTPIQIKNNDQQALDIWSGNVIYSWLCDCPEDLEIASQNVWGYYNSIRDNFDPPKEKNRNAKILILSAYEKNKYNMNNKADCTTPIYYPKPLDIDELIEFLDEEV